MTQTTMEGPLYIFEGSGAPECKINRPRISQLRPEIQAIYDELGIEAFMKKGYLDSDWPVCSTPINETVNPEQSLNEIASAPGLQTTAIIELPMTSRSNWSLTPGENEQEDLRILTQYLRGFGRDLEILKINKYWVFTFQGRSI